MPPVFVSMMAQEIVTSVQEDFKLTIVLCDSQGYASIGALSQSLGSGGFGTQYRYRDPATGALTGPPLPVDLAANAASLGAIVHRVSDRSSLDAALLAARSADRTTVIHVPVDASPGVPGYDAWWNVAVAEVSDQPAGLHRIEFALGHQLLNAFECGAQALGRLFDRNQARQQLHLIDSQCSNRSARQHSFGSTASRTGRVCSVVSESSIAERSGMVPSLYNVHALPAAQVNPSRPYGGNLSWPKELGDVPTKLSVCAKLHRPAENGAAAEVMSFARPFYDGHLP